MSLGEVVPGVAVETLRALVQASPFVLLGLLVAGLLHEFLDTTRIVRALGGRDLRSILTATLLGAPLPLCSCGVLPAALSLRKKGASREATIAFLISTPETGADSIALTYGLLGPLMAVARPLAAILTGVLAGALSLLRPEGQDIPLAGPDAHVHAVDTVATQEPRTLRARVFEAAHYGFVDLLDELAFWLLLAFVVTGVLSAALPSDFFQRYLPGGVLSLVVMAALGIPLYVCASASTPVAAAMVAKGLNPGAALVFMLTGPATNASTLAIVARLFGRRFAATYLGAIFAVALGAGVVVNLLAGASWMPAPGPAVDESSLWAWVQTAAALALAALMFRSLKRTGLRAGVAELVGHMRALGEVPRTIEWGGLPWKSGLRITLAVAGIVWLAQGVVVVGPGEEGLLRIFGLVKGSRLEPGLHFYWPPPIGRVDIVGVTAVRTIELGYMSLPEPGRVMSVPRSYPPFLPSFGAARTTPIPEGSTYVAGDETVVMVAGVVQYRVSDSARYRFGVDHPENLIRAVARSTLVVAIAGTPIDAIYSSARGEVEARALASLRSSPTVAATGVAPLALRLLYVHAPDEVHWAFRDVASAAEDATTIRNKALVEAEGAVRLARGEAARLVAEAESYRVRQVEHARGNASAFVPLVAEDRRGGALMRDRLYLEAMERVLPRVPKVLKPDGRRLPGLELWITSGGVTNIPGLGGGSLPPVPQGPGQDDEENPPPPGAGRLPQP